MPNELDFAKKKLFEEWRADNVKLFPGKSRDATPVDLARQIAEALDELTAGNAQLVDDFKDDD
jgi:hypothetical protein